MRTSSSRRDSHGFGEKAARRAGQRATLFLFAALLAGCSRKDAGVPGRVAFDLQVAALDSGAPSNSFDDKGGSMSLGTGWAPEEGSGVEGDPWRACSWAIGKTAKIEFVAPPGPRFDFWAECAPFEIPGGQPQSLSLELGGRQSVPTVLRHGWQAIRVPVPAIPSEPGGRLVDLTLRFETAASPLEAGVGKDRRKLAVAFNHAAIVPSSMPDPPLSLAAARLDVARRTLSLPVGGAYAIPIPAMSRLTFHLGDVAGNCRDCSLAIDRLPPGSPEERVWTRRARDAAGSLFSILNPEDRIATARILAISEHGPEFDPQRSIRITLPGDFVRVDPADGIRTSPARPRHPNVFVYLIDTMRAGDLSLYGARRPTSPRIDAFAQDAVTYRSARAASSWTLPSTASLLTGVFPFRHQLITGERFAYARGVPVLADLLRKAGYETVGISHSFLVSPIYGLAAGFETFLWRDSLNGTKLSSQTARRRFVSWLTGAARPGRPIFAYVHTVDPHAPYTPGKADREFADGAPGSLPEVEYSPENFMAKGLGSRAGDVAHLRALYDGEIHHADAEFGRFVDLLKFLGLYENSLIVLATDHGEEFGDHGGFGHGRTMFEEMLRVPLVIRFPGGRWKGSEVSQGVSLVDLAPTILDVAQVDRSRVRFDGRNLAPPSAAAPGFPGRPLFAELHALRGPGLAEVQYDALWTAKLKCIFNARGTDQFSRPAATWSVYDLESDPRERTPLSPGSPAFSRGVSLLQRWIDVEKKSAVPDPGEHRASDEMIDRLRALGYLR
ncbi:MAG: sulfatase [Thermoanaerobaculia bacterium]